MFHFDSLTDFSRKSREHLFTPEQVARKLCKKGITASRKAAKCPTEPIDYPVDFVVTWVDSSDLDWLSKKEAYFSELHPNDKKNNSSCRYREWNLFRYWFRAVEKYAPWVRYVWLVTCGHTPEWLNLDHPKLKVVRHDEFIPTEYLPTFNTECIELNLWRIAGLSEHFVYFNDDFYLFNTVSKEDFFTGDLPNLCAVAMPLSPHDHMTAYEHSILNVIGLFNTSFKIRKIMYEAPEKWFYYGYDEQNRFNRITYTLANLYGMYNPHLPLSMRRSSMEQCYNSFTDSFHRTCLNKFRSMEDIINQVFFIWEMLHNTFEPVAPDHYGKYFDCRRNNLDEIIEAFSARKRYKTICLNDNELLLDEDYEYVRDTVVGLMDQRLPYKSTFEVL